MFSSGARASTLRSASFKRTTARGRVKLELEGATQMAEDVQVGWETFPKTVTGLRDANADVRRASTAVGARIACRSPTRARTKPAARPRRRARAASFTSASCVEKKRPATRLGARTKQARAESRKSERSSCTVLTWSRGIVVGDRSQRGIAERTTGILRGTDGCPPGGLVVKVSTRSPAT